MQTQAGMCVLALMMFFDSDASMNQCLALRIMKVAATFANLLVQVRADVNDGEVQRRPKHLHYPILYVARARGDLELLRLLLAAAAEWTGAHAAHA